MHTVPTLELVHKALARGNSDQEVSKLARSVLSVIAFNLQHPTVKISEKQKKIVDTLEKLVHTC